MTLHGNELRALLLSLWLSLYHWLSLSVSLAVSPAVCLSIETPTVETPTVNPSTIAFPTPATTRQPNSQHSSTLLSLLHYFIIIGFYMFLFCFCCFLLFLTCLLSFSLIENINWTPLLNVRNNGTINGHSFDTLFLQIIHDVLLPIGLLLLLVVVVLLVVLLLLVLVLVYQMALTLVPYDWMD